MKIAVMSTLPSLEGVVPDTFETAPAMLIVETDDGSICCVMENCTPAQYVKKIVDTWCEAVVCGVHIGKEAFDPIADASITRYNGAGLDILTAARKADRGLIPIIPEYEGGPGCGGGGGSCDDNHCHSH